MKKLALILCLASAALIPTFSQIEEESKENVVLQTLGATAGLMMYQTYICIGSVADGFEHNIYEASQSLALTEEQVNSCALMVTQYQTLISSGFLKDSADIAFVNDFIDAMTLLRQEAIYLKDYINDQTAGNANLYQESRIKAWNAIAVLLDLE